MRRHRLRAAREHPSGEWTAVDLWSLVQIFLRRWYIVLPLVALTLFSAFAFTASIQPTYEADGSAILVGPEANETVVDESAIGANNRLLQLGGSLGTVAEVLDLSLSSQQARQQFADAGLVSDFQTGTDARSPIMLFTVQGDDPELVNQTMVAIFDFLDVELAAQQEAVNVPADELIELRSISAGDVPAANHGARQRSLVLILIGGLLVTTAVTIAVDAIASARRRRGEEGAQPDDAGVESTPDEVGDESMPLEAVSAASGSADSAVVAGPVPVDSSSGRGRVDVTDADARRFLPLPTNGSTPIPLSALTDAEAALVLPSLTDRDRRLVLHVASGLDAQQLDEVLEVLEQVKPPAAGVRIEDAHDLVETRKDRPASWPTTRSTRRHTDGGPVESMPPVRLAGEQTGDRLERPTPSTARSRPPYDRATDEPAPPIPSTAKSRPSSDYASSRSTPLIPSMARTQPPTDWSTGEPTPPIPSTARRVSPPAPSTATTQPPPDQPSTRPVPSSPTTRSTPPVTTTQPGPTGEQAGSTADHSLTRPPHTEREADKAPKIAEAPPSTVEASSAADRPKPSSTGGPTTSGPVGDGPAVDSPGSASRPVAPESETPKAPANRSSTSQPAKRTPAKRQTQGRTTRSTADKPDSDQPTPPTKASEPEGDKPKTPAKRSSTSQRAKRTPAKRQAQRPNARAIGVGPGSDAAGPSATDQPEPSTADGGSASGGPVGDGVAADASSSPSPPDEAATEGSPDRTGTSTAQ